MSLDPYQKRLVAFLSVATFFEGYDFFALAQILPSLRAELSLSPTAAGILLAIINLGTVLAGLVVRLADRFGRRRMLSVTIAGYTICSLLTAAATDVGTFGVAQLLARIFLIGEWAIAMVVAAEELPAERRGTMIGIIQGAATLGAITCAAIVPLLLKTSLGWRAVYVAGAVPLVLVALARRSLRETRRFSERAAEAKAPSSALELLRGPYRGRVLSLGLIWSFTYLCTQSATTFWKEFAVGERGFTDGQVGAALSISALAAMPLVFFSGKLIDALGRRRGGTIIFLVGALGVVLAYTLSGFVPLTIALVLGVFGTNAALPVLNAYTAELFPTERRADAFALANNGLGRIGYVLSPAIVGVVAERAGFGVAVAGMAVPFVLALALILRGLPETRGRELEDTAKLS